MYVSILHSVNHFYPRRIFVGKVGLTRDSIVYTRGRLLALHENIILVWVLLLNADIILLQYGIKAVKRFKLPVCQMMSIRSVKIIVLGTGAKMKLP